MTTPKEIKVFRFKADIVLSPVCELRSEGPIPIFNTEDKLIGFASINPETGALDCAIDPNHPERLDIETGSKPYGLDADLQYRGLQLDPVAYILALRLMCSENKDLASIYGVQS